MSDKQILGGIEELSPSLANEIEVPKGTVFAYLDIALLLELTKDIPLATEFEGYNHYSLGFFWTNGSIIGCKKIPIYIFVYDINLDEFDFNPDDNINWLGLSVIPPSNYLQNYSLLIASINETTGYYNPNFYPVDNDINEATGTFTYYNYGNSGENPPVYMKNFRQNETTSTRKPRIRLQQNPNRRYLPRTREKHPIRKTKTNISTSLCSFGCSPCGIFN